MNRTRSVSEVGSRPGPESLYRLDAEEVWDVIESNWTEVDFLSYYSCAKLINISGGNRDQK